jgi:hypothetical protein
MKIDSGVGGGVAVGAADAALAMRVQFLELQLKMQREVAADRERWALVQLEEQRKIFKLNTEGLSGLVENVIQANTGGRAAQDDPFVKAQLARAEKLERELEELRRETTRAQVKAASKTGGDEESGLAKMFFEHVAPELMSQVKESRELERKRLELEERRIRMVGESGTVIDGERDSLTCDISSGATCSKNIFARPLSSSPPVFEAALTCARVVSRRSSSSSRSSFSARAS